MIHERKNTNVRYKNCFTTLVHFQTSRSERKKGSYYKGRKKNLSEVGFEPTPTYVDQNASNSHLRARNVHILESGALDHSATLTARLKSVQIAL